jgi:hypothetical protein
MQCQAALWITGAFRTSPTGGAESLAGLLPISLVLKKLSADSIAWVVSLSDTYLVHSLMSGLYLKCTTPHPSSISLMFPAVKAKVIGSLMQADDILLMAIEVV